MKMFGDATILCGGKSSRMGFDKSLIKINGKYILQDIHDKLSTVFDRVFLSANPNTNISKFSIFEIELIQDIHADIVGPAAAVHTALTNANSDYVFVIACDMPLINSLHIYHMMSVIKKAKPQALIPVNNNYKEVLYAFYHKSTLQAFHNSIKAGDYKMQIILDQLDTYYLAQDESEQIDPQLKMFTNLNYQTDIKKVFGKDIIIK